ncbi:MAG: pitrilysin family protein [Oscillospiraceae bacterium]|nr:pitrilysin family protein [Oscillospiraceae bacterium]
MKTKQILPGVRLTAIKTDKFKTAGLSVSLLRPLRPEEAAMNALLPSVMLRGTARYCDMASISEFLDACYGAGVGGLIRKRGEVQTLGFYADFINDRLAPDGAPILADIVDFIGQLLLRPVLEEGILTPSFVEGEKQNLINTIASQINDKRTYADKRLREIMFEGETFATGRLGSEEAVANITPEALTKHWRSVLETSQLELFYVGEEDADTLAPLLQQAFADLPRGALLCPHTIVRPEVTREKIVTETMDVTQGKLSIGLRTPITARDARYPALMLMNQIFGGGVTSKLFTHVREERSLCYYASSSLGKHKGTMTISSGIDSADYETAKTAILAELAACKAGQITTQELETARRYAVSSLRAGMDNPSRLDDYSIGQIIEGLPGTLEDLMVSVESLTMEEIVAAANTLQLDTIYFLKGADA